MKILKLELNRLYIWAIILCMTNFFGFYKYLPFGTTFYKEDYMYLWILAVSSIFLFFLIIKGYKKIRLGTFGSCSLELFLLISLETIWTYLQYHQPIILTMKEGLYYLMPLLSYLVFVQFRNTNLNAKIICDIFVRAGIIASSVAIIAFILYTYAEINILQLAENASTNFRYGTIRFSVGSLVVYMSVIISLTRVFGKSHSFIDVLNLCLSSIHIIVINKTRTIILYFIIMVLLLIIIGKKIKKSLKIFIILLIAVCLFLIFLSLDTISGGVTDYVGQDAGIMMRFNTISFYMNQFRKVPVLGMGLISSSRDVEGWQLLYGPNGYYYRDDVGIFGLLNKFGILGLLWAIFFIKYIFTKLKGIKTEGADSVRNILLYCIITMINLSFMDPQRVMYVFIVMIISEIILREKCNISEESGFEIS